MRGQYYLGGGAGAPEAEDAAAAGDEHPDWGDAEKRPVTHLLQ